MAQEGLLVGHGEGIRVLKVEDRAVGERLLVTIHRKRAVSVLAQLRDRLKDNQLDVQPSEPSERLTTPAAYQGSEASTRVVSI